MKVFRKIKSNSSDSFLRPAPYALHKLSSFLAKYLLIYITYKPIQVNQLCGHCCSELCQISPIALQQLPKSSWPFLDLIFLVKD